MRLHGRASAVPAPRRGPLHRERETRRCPARLATSDRGARARGRPSELPLFPDAFKQTDLRGAGVLELRECQSAVGDVPSVETLLWAADWNATYRQASTCKRRELRGEVDDADVSVRLHRHRVRPYEARNEAGGARPLPVCRGDGARPVPDESCRDDTRFRLCCDPARGRNDDGNGEANYRTSTDGSRQSPTHGTNPPRVIPDRRV